MIKVMNESENPYSFDYEGTNVEIKDHTVYFTKPDRSTDFTLMNRVAKDLNQGPIEIMVKDSNDQYYDFAPWIRSVNKLETVKIIKKVLHI